MIDIYATTGTVTIDGASYPEMLCTDIAATALTLTASLAG